MFMNSKCGICLLGLVHSLRDVLGFISSRALNFDCLQAGEFFWWCSCYVFNPQEEGQNIFQNLSPTSHELNFKLVCFLDCKDVTGV